MIGSDLNKIPGKNLETNVSMQCVCVCEKESEQESECVHVVVFMVWESHCGPFSVNINSHYGLA